MIPIIYDKTETAFTSNGLGRLRDCISCIVTEERNGIYECDFEYPMDGAHYDLIKIGRIIGVTHDETDDIQPFDIVSYEKTIEGTVVFHATHISYRQSYMTVKGTNINSLADAFTLLGTATPTNPFTYSTDKSSSGYLACADGVPRTVRQMLGGIEGSILDIYGGEYEWNKFNVTLHAARGQARDFTIRYGVNMLEYNEECDSSNAYSSCIPYWTDGTTTVVGDKQTHSGTLPSERECCVPLDISDRFESQPTKAQVNSMGLSVMNSQNPTTPAQNITVSFVRLQDMGEYTAYQNLMQCSLCDTIKIVFPDYDATAQIKIVKIEWNVLKNKYESMELGTLAVSLAEALGITPDGSGTTSSGGSVTPDDYVTEQGTSGIWTYRKWNSGIMECWGTYKASIAVTTSSGAYGGYRSGLITATAFPVAFASTPVVTAVAQGAGGYWVNNVGDSTSTNAKFYLSAGSSNAASNKSVSFHCIGTWQ